MNLADFLDKYGWVIFGLVLVVGLLVFVAMPSSEKYQNLERNQTVLPPDTKDKNALPDHLKPYLAKPKMQGVNILDSVGKNPNWDFRYPKKQRGPQAVPIYKVDYEQPTGLANGIY
jgi:hypothetical protein